MMALFSDKEGERDGGGEGQKMVIIRLDDEGQELGGT